MPAARLATTADIAAATETLALAHQDYEWTVWAFPHADRAALVPQLVRIDVTIGIAAKCTWVTDRCESVAIWSPPQPTAPASADVEAMRAEQDRLIGADVARVQAADALTRPHHPEQPYWYLGTVGTRPDRGGRGLATAVVQPILDRCDDEHTMACLETSTEDNVRLYRRLGFDETFRVNVGEGALPLIVMHRSPR